MIYGRRVSPAQASLDAARSRSVSPGEAALAAALERHVGSLSMSHRHRLLLEQDVYDGVRWWAGPHVCGWVERSPGGVRVRLVDTKAGRTAQALLEEELIDVVLSDDYPPSVRLTALGGNPEGRETESFRHGGGCDMRSATEPSVLRALLKVTEREGYWWVECGACDFGWQTPFFAEESVG